MELDCPLPLRVEANNPQLLYYDWKKLLYRSDVKSRVLPHREEVFQEYENLIETEGQIVAGYLAQ